MILMSLLKTMMTMTSKHLDKNEDEIRLLELSMR